MDSQENKKKSVAIITCCREPNYGACLQAHATQLTIEKLGYEAEIIDYSFEKEKSYSPFSQRKLSSFIACFLYFRLRKSIYLEFQDFYKKMRFSKERYQNIDDFKNKFPKYDIILTGSDQVWNPELGIDTRITLQTFTTNQVIKVSYASSFGICDISQRYMGLYSKALLRFNSISVREKQGQQIVKALTGRDVPIVLDPTMLLSKEEWNMIASEAKKSGYVLIYDTQHSRKLIEMALKYAQKANMQVCALSRIQINTKGIKTLEGVSPEDFLSLVRDAECVFTDSFHGTIFSLLFHKKVLIYFGGSGKRLSGRILNLLNLLDLNNRITESGIADLTNGIDYYSIDDIIKKHRYLSLTYLKYALEGGNTENDKQV